MIIKFYYYIGWYHHTETLDTDKKILRHHRRGHIRNHELLQEEIYKLLDEIKPYIKHDDNGYYVILAPGQTLNDSLTFYPEEYLS